MASILDEFLILFKPTVQGNGFQQLNKQIKQTHESLFSMKNLFGAFVGFDIYSGLKQFGASLVNATREMGAMESRFYAITGDMSKANDQLEWAFKLAERTAMPMKSLADSYSIFYAATQKGLGDAGAQQVFQDWTEVSRVLHMSEYQFERVTYALREMASKGVVYSQDLRMQIGTHVPNAVGLAEKAVNDLGITGTDWFEKFQKQSKGNQKMINEFLKLFSKYAKEQFADPEALKKAMQMPDAQIARLQNQWQKIRFGIADSGFGNDLAKILTKLNDTLDKLTNSIDYIYDVIKDIAKIIGLIVGLLAFRKLFTGFRRLSVMLKGIKKGHFWGKFIKAFGQSGKYIKNVFKNKGFFQAFKLFFKLIGKNLLKNFFTLGLKGAISFIPIIGQIADIFFIIEFACQAIYHIIKIFWPEAANSFRKQILSLVWQFRAWWKELNGWIKTLINLLPGIALAFINPFLGVVYLIGVIIKGIQYIRAWQREREAKKAKNDINSFKVTPDTNSWDYVQKQNMLPLSNYAGGQQYNFNPTISYENNIDASGLTPEQVSALIADSNIKNNEDLMAQFKNNIGGSKNKP